MASIFDYRCSACRTVYRSEDKGNNVKWDETELFPPWEHSGRGIERDVKLLQKLAKYAELGCKRCALLHTLLRHIYSPETGLDYNFQFLEWSCSAKVSKLHLESSFNGYLLYAIDASRPNPYNLPYQQDMPGNTSSESTLEKMHSWITDCNENHDKCKRVQRDGLFSPDRLLDLRDDKVRLVEGIKCHRYICLSHCWGPPEKLVRMTLHKKKEFQNDIPFHTLSKTFQEAIDICRRLYINFLWIDALCIIQDSVEDWRAQSSLMADIYENAYLTIFATKARESSEGLYADYSNVDLGQKVDDLENVHMRYFNQREMYPDSIYSGFWDLNKWPLLTRAWAYQEQRLSRRRLHFGGNEVIWHCETRMASEGGFTDRDGDQTPDRDYTDWHKTVQRYTLMKMTVKSDRLVALAGIVKRMLAVRPRDRYLAGLWESTLLSDLLWMEDLGSSYGMRPKGRTNRHLPSFSWGSVDSYISYNLEGYTPLDTVTVVQVHYVPLGPVELGRPAEAYIKIESPILKAKLISRGSEKRYERIRVLKLANSFEGKAEYDIPILDYEFETLGDFEKPCSNVALLFLLKHESECFKGLILRERRDGKYLRIGTISMSFDEKHGLKTLLNSRPRPTITLV